MRLNGNEASPGAVVGYVMAGGASRRFGSDKALAMIGDETVLARIHSLVAQSASRALVVAPRNRYLDSKLEIVEDLWPDEGPLGGIITALRYTNETLHGCEWNLMVSCDMPFLTREWLSYLCERAFISEAEVVVPQSEHGLEPLCACWRTAALVSLQQSFDAGARKVTEAMKRLRMEVLDETHWKRFDSAGRLFWNMNTAKDYEEALRFAKMENP